jgi:hypothetical protein
MINESDDAITIGAEDDLEKPSFLRRLSRRHKDESTSSEAKKDE